MNAPFLPSGVKVLQVGELTQAIKGVLEEGFANFWVEGEISGCKRHASGHLYLTLKDECAQIKAVLWRSVVPRLRFEPKNGLAVVVRGRLDVYAPHGEYKLVIEQMLPQGIGALELAFQQLREKLFSLGYFEPRRKKPLPRMPRRIALVTSPTGAAVRDMVQVLIGRWPAAEVVVCPVRVQGDGAAAEIAAAVAHLNRLHVDGRLAIDVMIVGRGGGSLEDLWAFNEEVLAAAIFASRIPVVSAVGHETDVTIADLVADHRALTPTHAATAVVPDRQELLSGLRNFEGRLHDCARRALDRARERVDDLASRRAFRLPLERIREHERRLDDWSERLERAGSGRLQRAQEHVKSLTARLDGLSPLNILARGYSVTQDVNGAVVRDAANLRPGNLVTSRLHRGRIACRVEGVERE
jgi:exodeoxyribonuclease VII large subunit